MELIGTIQLADGTIDHITVHGNSHDTARETLDAAAPDGETLTVIRTDS